jgi:hypothetical protein
MNKVWDKHTSFGCQFDNIKHFFKAMFELRTQEEWDSAFQNARWIVICFLPSPMEKLEKIHHLPKYNSGYYLREMEGGQGGLWCIAEQIKYLLECQKD